MKMRQAFFRSLYFTLSLCFLLVCACDSASDSVADGDLTDGDATDGDATDGDDGAELESRLNDLGVDTSDLDPIPEGFNPLGHTTAALAPTHELMVLGPKKGGSPFSIIDDGANDYTTLFKEESVGFEASGLKAATSGDIDADGFDEAVIVSLGADNTFIVRVYDDADNGFQLLVPSAEIAWPFGDSKPNDIDIAMGDIDADSKAELVLGIGGSGTLQNDEGEDETFYKSVFYVTKIQGDDIAIIGQESFDDKSLRVAVGNINDDLQEEIAVSIRGMADVNAFRLYAYNNGAITELERGIVQFNDDDGDLVVCGLSDVAIGDIDADGKGEIVFGGLQKDIIDQPPSTPLGFLMMALALDDEAHHFNPIAGKVFLVPALPISGGQFMRAIDAFTEIVDLEGDYQPEILINNVIFKNFAASEEPWENFAKMEATSFYNPNLTNPLFHRSKHALAVGDFTGDGKENIAFFPFMTEKIQIHGLDVGGNFKKLDTVSASFNGDWPALCALNTDMDSSVVKYEGDYKYVFTAPIVLAALAAPPCRENIGQNLSSCATYYGNAQSETITKENSLSFKASFIIGTSIEDRTFTQSAFELEAELSIAVKQTFTNSRTEEVSVVFSSGALEDSVVFLTIPYDVYTYTIVSHPNEELIGETTTISTPRKPVILIAEREFYNQTVGPDYLQVDNEVFKHTIQDLSSYPSRTKKDELLDTYGGMESPEYSVGQGGGGTDLSINVSEEWGEGTEMEIGFDLTLKTTVGGVTIGGSIGMSTTFGVMITSGESTTYGGTVGSIDADNYADNQFVFGLFTYPYMHSKGQQFHVINYFVEEL